MAKPIPREQESEAERAHVLEQMKISLAQARAGHGLTAEESLADLERAEAPHREYR